MKNLLNKEHSCCKIHIYITNESSACPFSIDNPFLWAISLFYKKILTPTSQKFQPNYK